MIERTEALHAVAEELARISGLVTPELFDKACEEINGCMPPWAKTGRLTMDGEAIFCLMVACWLRGHKAYTEWLS